MCATNGSPLFRVAAVIGTTKINLVVDTGAAVSILPPKCISGINLSPTDVKISSAGGQTIRCHGECFIEIQIPQLRRNFFWRFVVADVTVPLLGADFLSSHDLLINCRERKLLDATTNREIICCLLYTSPSPRDKRQSRMPSSA